MSTERLNQSSDRIKESRRTMLETEELGVSILQDLHQQRQSLLHANNTVCPLHVLLLVHLQSHRFIRAFFTFWLYFISCFVFFYWKQVL